jgi:hypothetical protein
MADEIQKVSWDTSRANAELGAPRELVLNQNLTEGPELITQDNAGLDAFHFPSEEKLILSDSSELIGFNDTGLTYISGSTLKDAIDSIDAQLASLASGAYSFLGLTDTPSAYTGQAGKVVKVNATEDGLEFGTGGGGSGTFIGLTDVPASYTGQSLKAVRVNSGETALEFYTLSINSLLPSQSGNSGKYLTTDGTNTSWATVAGGGVSGSGTTNYLPLWTGSSALGDSVLSQSGGNLSATGNFNIASTKTYKIDNSNVLDVNGTSFSRIANSGTNTGSYCMFAGRDVGSNNPNNWNVYGGVSIGVNTPSSIGNGFNVAFGGNMFNALTSGNKNTAIGISCLLSVTSGFENVCIGFNVASSLNTGSGNSLIGATLGGALTSGSNNTAFSSYALNSCSSGNGNVALGYSSFNQLAINSYNSGVGYLSGYYGTGTENTCMGAFSGANVASGDYNTYVGARSGFNPTAGVVNIARNTAVGSYAGSDGNVSDCVYVGYQSGTLNTRAHTLFIHNTNNITSPLIYGEFDNKHLRTGGSFAWSVTDVKTTTYTTAISDGTVRCDASGGGFTVNLHTAVGYKGKILVIKRVEGGTNTITVDGNSTETIDGSTTQTITTAYGVLRLQSDGANWMII